jgi:hypothetical protein
MSLLQSPWIPGRTGLIDNIFLTRDQNDLKGKNQQNLTGLTTPQMRRLKPGAGVIRSREPDCSPQETTVVTISPELSKNQN